jgi:hypothetical protein
MPLTQSKNIYADIFSEITLFRVLIQNKTIKLRIPKSYNRVGNGATYLPATDRIIM